MILVAPIALTQQRTTANLSFVSGALSFLPAVTYGTGGITPQSVAIGDLNGDGRPDLVVGNYYSDKRGDS